MRLLAAIAVALLLVSCGDSSDPLPPPSAVARFDPSFEGPMDWGDVPFPSDLYRDTAGAVRLGALPTARSDEPLFGAFRELIASRGGFCVTCNAYFPIEGELDAGTLPAGDGLAPEPSPADPILLADVDPASPERGRLFPVRVEWDPRGGFLALRPARGSVLHRVRRYAAVLTSQVRASDGTPLGASDIFRHARDGGRSDDPRVEKVRESIAPALEELTRFGVDRDAVVALAVFTTDDVPRDLLEVRAVVQEGAELTAVVDRVRLGEEIDELLGFPAADRPGIDVPPVAGSGGTRSIAHAEIAEVITGRFSAPRVLAGSGTDIGTALRDADGRVAAGPREDVPFVLTIPRGADREHLPVAIAHHGFNASRVTGFATADTAARAGVAVLAIDAFQHGERAASARDELHAMRGDVAGADGFAETTPTDVSARVFGLVGAAPGLELFPGYSLGCFLQFAADVFSAARLVREGGLDRAVTAGGATVRFDPERVGFVGNSLGAVVGSAVLVAEPSLRAAVQNVQPGSIVETLAESPEFRPLVEALFLPNLGVEGPFDEVDRHLLFDPIVDLSRWVLDPVDPLALAPYLFRDPLRAERPEVLFQVAALDEVAAPLATDSMLAASDAPLVTRYDPAAHGMLEVLNQSSRYEPPAVPPFRLRPAAVPVTNPIVAEHDEIAEFLSVSLAGRP
jgi:hypothetical protein